MGIGQVLQPVQANSRPGCVPGAALFVAIFTSFVSVLPLVISTPVHSETLRQALAKAYRFNPRLDAARARLRVSDEDVSRAQSGWRPVITGSGDYGYQSTKTTPRSTSNGSTNSWGYSLNVTQPVFDGFQTRNRVRGAEASVRAERESLRLVEQQTLLQATTSYMDVMRDQAVVALRSSNVSVLTRALRAAKARRAEREITRTDVAQSRARRARAVAQLEAARANLKSSRAAYRLVIGELPGKLRRPSYRNRLIPSTLRSALEIAAKHHPNILGAKFREQAERHNVDRVRGELLPDVRIEASYAKRFDGSVNISQQEDARITGRVTIPFYRGGEVHARVRQAKHQHVGRLQEIEQARLEVEAGVMAAWSQLRAARSRLTSGHVQVEASMTALEGVREEEKVGQRTIIEVLNAQQELLDAKVTLTSTRRDLVVAAYTMIAAIGRLNVQDLAVVQEAYDPEEHYLEVRDQRFGITIADDEVRDGSDAHGDEENDDMRADEALLGGPVRARVKSRRVSRSRRSWRSDQRAATRQRHDDASSGGSAPRKAMAATRRKVGLPGGSQQPGNESRKLARRHSEQYKSKRPKSKVVARAKVQPRTSRQSQVFGISTASIAASSNRQQPVDMHMPSRPPIGFRGAMGVGHQNRRIYEQRTAADLSVVGLNRKVTIIRGARHD